MSIQIDSKAYRSDELHPQEMYNTEKENETRPPSLSESSGRYIHQEDGVTKIEALCECSQCLLAVMQTDTPRYGLWQRLEVVSFMGFHRLGSLRLLVSLLAVHS
jgi:hypothetical protein